MKKQIICLRWGDKYGVDHVNRLYRGIKRNITPPFTFHCITDNADGLDEGIEIIDLPELGCDMPTGTWGIWGKSRLWNDRLGDLSGPVLFMDIDAVVTGNVDAFFEFGEADDVILARNPVKPLERLGQTSIYRFPVGKLASLRERFLADPQGIADEYRFEQRFVTRNAPGGIRFWPHGWVATFRSHCTRLTPLNYVLEPKLPPAAKVVIFPGALNPDDALAGRWMKEAPSLSRREHLKRLFTGPRVEGRWSHFRHWLKPPAWLREHWSELR